MVVWDIDPPGGGGPTIIRHWIAHHGHVNAVAFTPPTASNMASSSGYDDEHLYNIQCSEIFTLRNEKLHTEA